MIIKTESLSDLFTAVKTAFNKGFRGAKAEWSKVATLVPSTAAAETYAWLGQFPKLREWIGDRVIKNMEAHDYTIKNKKFESSVGIPRDTIDDDSYGVFMPLYEEMGHAAATHPDELVFGVLAAGFNNPCYDKQNFFDTDHPVGPAGNEVSVSNMQAGAGAPWFLLAADRPLKPIIFQKRRDYDIKGMTDAKDEAVFMRDEYRYGVDARGNAGYGFWQQAFGSKATLSAENFEAAYDAIMGFKSDEGRPLKLKPSILVVGPSNRAAAQKIIEKKTLADGSDNTNYQIVELLVVGDLT